MLNIRVGGVCVQIRLWFSALCLYLLYTNPDPIVLWAVSAAIWHEVGHLSAMIVCRACPQRIVLSAFGMRMDMDPVSPLSPAQEMVVALAGPLFNGCAALFLKTVLPDAAIVHTALLVWNLLPMKPLDGERISHHACSMVFSEKAVFIIMRVMFWVLWPLMMLLSMYLLVRQANPTLAVVTIYCGIYCLQNE